MAELYSTEHKFLMRNWSYYQLHDFSFPHHASIYNFIRCFENLSPHCTVRVTPYGFEHLLCATLLIDMKPGAQETLAKAKSIRRKSLAKQRQTAHKAKKRSSGITSPTKSSRDARNDSDQNIPDIPKMTKATYTLKICLDPIMDLLFSSRLLPQWLQVCLGRCLGVTGQMELVSVVRGEPRHIVHLVSQRGGARDTETSSQASMEHEYMEALQRRGRCYGPPVPLGPVTKMLGAMPNNFPRVQDISATYKKVPMSSLPAPSADIDEAKLQQCRKDLARLTISRIRVHLSSPSLLHFYHNASREVYQARENLTDMLKTASNVGVVSVASVDGERSDGVVTTVPPTQVPHDVDEEGESEQVELVADDAGSAAAAAAPSTKSVKNKKTKFNLEGVVTEVPFFIQRLRAKGTFRPVLEYK